MAWIYILESPSGKMYVGQTTKTVKERFHGHINDAKRYDYPLSNAIKKYGLDNFNIYKFECGEEDLDFFERGFIKQLGTLKPNGYNLESGGNKNKHINEETKIKLSKINKGKKYNFTKEQIKRRIDAVIKKCKGRKASIETREKLRLSHLGQKAWNKGLKCPQISSAQKGKKISEELKKYWSIKRKGKQTGKEHWRSKKVICIETGEIFDNARIAAESKTIYINQSCIHACCKNKIKKTGGYHWKYYLNENSIQQRMG